MGKKDEAKWNGKERGRLKKEKDVKNEADNLKKRYRKLTTIKHDLND